MHWRILIGAPCLISMAKKLRCSAALRRAALHRAARSRGRARGMYRPRHLDVDIPVSVSLPYREFPVPSCAISIHARFPMQKTEHFILYTIPRKSYTGVCTGSCCHPPARIGLRCFQRSFLSAFRILAKVTSSRT